mgnify:CR=1 FL=1
MDYWTRRVPNDWWIRWGVAIVFLLCIEMMLLGADFALILTGLGIVAWASISVIGTPSISDMKNGSYLDWGVSFWYLFGIIGLVCSILLHGENALWILGFYADPPLFSIKDATNLELAVNHAQMLLDLFGLLIMIGFVELAWRMRLLHGGADAKALMIVAIALPWWPGFDVLGVASMIPPMVSVLVWSAIGFLFLPIKTLFTNISNGSACPLLENKKVMVSPSTKSLLLISKDSITSEITMFIIFLISTVRKLKSTPDKLTGLSGVLAKDSFSSASSFITSSKSLLVFAILNKSNWLSAVKLFGSCPGRPAISCSASIPLRPCRLPASSAAQAQVNSKPARLAHPKTKQANLSMSLVRTPTRSGPILLATMTTRILSSIRKEQTLVVDMVRPPWARSIVLQTRPSISTSPSGRKWRPNSAPQVQISVVPM